MNSELKYILKGVGLAVLFLVTVYVIRYVITYKNPPLQAKEKVIIDPDALMNLPQIAAGKELFKTNCSACHPLYARVDGPQIQGFEERLNDRPLWRSFIRHSRWVISSGADPYFIAMSKQYAGVFMPDFPNLTNEEIDSILDYIKVVTAYQRLSQR